MQDIFPVLGLHNLCSPGILRYRSKNIIVHRLKRKRGGGEEKEEGEEERDDDDDDDEWEARERDFPSTAHSHPLLGR